MKNYYVTVSFMDDMSDLAIRSIYPFPHPEVNSKNIESFEKEVRLEVLDTFTCNGGIEVISWQEVREV